MKRNCKTCTLNTTNDTVETCKRMCYLRYSTQRRKRICDLEQEIIKLKQTFAEIKEIAKPYQKEIDKICGNCRRYDGCHACCMDTLNNYEYRTGTTKACDKFIELKDFDINKLANQILQKISECEGNDGL